MKGGSQIADIPGWDVLNWRGDPTHLLPYENTGPVVQVFQEKLDYLDFCVKCPDLFHVPPVPRSHPVRAISSALFVKMDCPEFVFPGFFLPQRYLVNNPFICIPN